MRDAAMPGHDEEIVVREKFPEYVGVREGRAQHQRPGNDSFAIHWLCAEHVLPAESRLRDQRAGDAVSDCIHAGESTGCAKPGPSQCTARSGERLATTLPTRRAATPWRCRVARAVSAASGAMATSRPPDVCGSKSRSWYSARTLGAKPAQSLTNAR